MGQKLKIGFKTFRIIILILIGIIGLLFYAFQWPELQTELSQKGAKWLTEKLGAKISIGNVNIKWLDEISIEDVNIKDLKGRDMIFVRELYVNFKLKFSLDKFIEFDNNLDFIMLKEPDVKLIKEEDGSLNIDLWIKKIASLKGEKDSLKIKTKLPFTIDEAVIEGGVFELNDPSKERFPKNQFDYFNFRIENISGNIKDFIVQKDTVIFVASSIQGKEARSNLLIKKIDTDFFYSKKQILLDNLDARINNTIIRDFLGLYYETPKDLNQLNTKVNLKLDLKNSILDAQDLGRFAPVMYEYSEKFNVLAKLEGKVSDLYMTDATIRFGENSFISARKGSFKGLPKVNETLYHINFNPSTIQTADVRQYAGDENYINYVAQFGKVDFTGLFQGTFSNLLADMQIRSSELGNVEGKLTYEKNEKGDFPIYNADLISANINLGKFIENEELVQNVVFHGRLKGYGNTVEDISLDIDGNIDEIGFKNYNYKDVTVKGLMRNSVFEGNVKVNDSNLVLDVSGLVDFNPLQTNYRIKGRVDNSNLKTLGFSEKEIELETNFDFNFGGDELDNWVGQAAFTNTYAHFNDRNLVIDDMEFLSEKTFQYRKMSFSSVFFDAGIEGNFIPSHLIKDISGLLHEYGLFFGSSEQEKIDFYEAKGLDTLRRFYNAQYHLTSKDSKDFFAFFNPDLVISQGSKFAGNMRINTTSQISAVASIDSFEFKGNLFVDNELDFYASKKSLSPEVLSSLILTSKSQNLVDKAETENIEIGAFWGESRKISFDAGIEQKETDNKAQIFGDITFLQEGFNIILNPNNSLVDLLGYRWGFDPNNKVTILGKEIQFEDFRIANEDQNVALSGFISKDPTKLLFIGLNHFDLRALEPLISMDLKGIAEGDMTISNYYNEPVILSDIIIKELNYNYILIGDIKAVVDWDNLLGKTKIEIKIDRDDLEVFNLLGSYDPSSKDGISLSMNLEKTNLEIFETFVGNVFSDIKGYADGHLTISGDPNDPILKGDLIVSEGQLKINGTGAYLYFDDTIHFNEDGFVTSPEGIKVYDAPENGHMAILKGGIFNGGNGNFLLDLHAFIDDPEGFQLINTSIEENDTFYGTANGTGDIHLTGAFTDVLISGNITTKRNSKMTIPLDGAESVDINEEAIPFAKNENEVLLAMEEIEDEVNRNKLTVAFNLTITPDTEIEIIFDRANNDKLTAFGNGRLSFEYDTRSSNFTMSGPFEVSRGLYNFSFQNLASLRKFEIVEGSRISWSGNPYEAILNLNAAYEASIDLSPIWSSTVSSQETDNTRYPVLVNVHITDQLQTPKIDYSLNFIESRIPTYHHADLLAFNHRLNEDEQLLTRNVSSVLVFNQIFPENNANDAFGQQFLIDNLNSMLSNQIGNLASKIDPNLEVGVLLGDLGENALNNMQLNFSYKFLDNRLKLSGTSSYSNGLYYANSTDPSQMEISVGGEIEYLLTEDGTWRLRVHSSSVPSSHYSYNFVSFNTGQVTVSGVNILFSRNFNTFFPKKIDKIPLGVGTKEDEVSLVD